MKLFGPFIRTKYPSYPFWLTSIAVSIFVLSTTPTVAQQPSSQDLLSQADEILQQMSQITGLPIKGPLKKQVISRPEIEKYLTQNLHEEMTPAEIHAQEALVRAFGLVSRDFNLEKFLISFYTEQAAGFYDPKRKTMFIADWIPAEMQTMVLSHELTHALQDQSWDLESYLHGARDDDDATSARQAVVEGYATAAMMQQAAGGVDLGQLPSLAPLMEMVIHQQFEEYPAFSNAPYFFRMQALFPYVQGMGFIQAGLQRGGWKDLNELFEHPPSTTKEIFEPQTYFNHQAVPHDRPGASAGARGRGRPTIPDREHDGRTRLLFPSRATHFRGRSQGAQRSWVATGICSTSAPVEMTIRWWRARAGRTPEAALAFFRDYHTILAQKYSDLTTDKRSTTDEFIGSAANGAVLLLRKGDECLWAEGVPAAKAEALLDWLRKL